MKFKELIDGCDFEKVIEIYKTLFDEESQKENNFDKIYNWMLTLRDIEPTVDEHTEGMTIQMTFIKCEYGDYYDVHGTREGDDTSYALEFCRFSEWMGMEVSDSVIKKHDTDFIVAQLVREMTFCGYDEEEIQDKSDELSRRCKEIESGTAETYTFDEVFGEKLLDS